MERANYTIKKNILSVIKANCSLFWINLLRQITYEYNIKYQRAIDKSPAKDTFGYIGFIFRSNILN